MSKALEYILPPELVRRSTREDRYEKRVSNWCVPWDRVEQPDAGLLMVPFSRAAQRGDNGGAGAPNALRLALTSFTTYSPDFDVDLQPLRVRDFGDTRLHMTDIPLSHRMIEEAVLEFYHHAGEPILISIGGDHSITCPLVQGYCRAHPHEQVGIVHFDAHNDVRNFEDGGPTNRTPFRGILEGPANVAGRNLVQIGIHGFMNSAYYKRYCDEQEITVISGRELRRRGIDDVMAQALAIASQGTDSIYVSFDIDVISSAWAPGTGASTPEGMEPWDALEAMFGLGREPKVKALDIVCIDPLRDLREATAKLGASLVLTFLGGLVPRRTGGKGY